MKTIEFNKKGIIYWLYAMTHINDAKDTCQYRGGLLLSFITILVAPWAVISYSCFMLVSSIRNSRKEQNYKLLVMSGICAFIAVMVGHQVLEQWADFIHWHKLSLFEIYYHSIFPLLTGLLTIIIVIGALAALALGIVVLVEWTRSKLPPLNLPGLVNKDTGEAKNQVGVLYLSLKDKWCNKINWN